MYGKGKVKDGEGITGFDDPSLLMLGAPVLLFAKGATAKIIVIGDDLSGLSRPIEIEDQKFLRQIHIWAGPGASSNESQGLIVDWSLGKAPKPSYRLPLYEIFFYTFENEQNEKEKLAYVVSYKYDPSTHRGYVYVPGKGDNWLSTNLGTIMRGVEGNWFHAWSIWDEFAKSFLTKAKVTS